MKRYFLFFFLIFALNPLIGQVKVLGVVMDSIGNPIISANVIAVNQDTKTIESYAITNNNGKYKLNVEINTMYKFTVSYVGLKTVAEEFNSGEDDIIKDFQLFPDNALDEVILTQNIPLKIKGDTLIYDADSFRNASDRKLGDVLKRLPGVEVDNDGKIKVEGKEVTRITVEDKPFFDGSTKLATTNIPANVLDKIQVLKNHDEVAMLRNLRDNDEKVYINITLKEGKKNFWFGEFSVNGGNKERYILHPTLFYYSPKKSVNIILDYNNVGETPLAQNDISRFSNSVLNPNQNSGTSFTGGELNSGSLAVRNNRAKSIDSKFMGANFSYVPKKFWDLNGFALYSGTRTDVLKNSLRQYTQSSENSILQNDETTTTNTRQVNDFGLLKLKSSYRPHINAHVEYDLIGRIANIEKQGNFFSSVLQDIVEQEKRKPHNIQQNLNYYRTIDDSNIIGVQAQHLLQNEDPFYNAILNRVELFAFADNLNLDQNQTEFNLIQDKIVKTQRLDAKFDYWHILNRNSNINFSLGISLNKQQFNSEFFQILDNGNPFRPSSTQISLINDVTYNFDDVYFGLLYRLKLGIITCSSGLNAHSFITKNRQLNVFNKDRFLWVLPNFKVKVQIKSTESVVFSYGMKIRFTDINNLVEGLVLNGYSELFQGNKDLESAKQHNFSLSYVNRIAMLSAKKSTILQGSINYFKTTDNFRNQIGSEGVLRISSPFNSNFEDEILSGTVGIERALGKYFRLGFTTVQSQSIFNQIFNDEVSTNVSTLQSYDFKIKTSWYLKKPSVEVGYRMSTNKYQLGGVSSKFLNDNIYLKGDYTFLGGFIFNADYSFFNYRNKIESLNKYDFFNASLSYQKKDSHWKYVLSATNILNTNSLNQDYTNEFFTNVTQYFVQPRYLLLGIVYNL